MPHRTSEELSLLLTYLSLIGIWFAIPSVTLLINRDKRWPIAVSILCVIIVFLLCCYILQWEVLFPRSASEIDKQLNIP
jgi:hypothetical protein